MFSNDGDRMRSFVGAQSEFQGEVVVRGTLRMDGLVTGRVQADQVILSETATIKGDVVAKKVIIGGKVEGTIRAPELVEIRSKGKVKGEIFTNNFSVMEGAQFNGRVEMGSDQAKVLDFESREQDVSLTHA
jgi:cytoskeletal protein CcmA (bactofilin family)